MKGTGRKLHYLNFIFFFIFLFFALRWNVWNVLCPGECPPRASVLLLLCDSTGTESGGLGVLFSFGAGFFSGQSSCAAGRREQRSLSDSVHLVTLKSVPAGSVCTVNKQGCKWKKKQTTKQKENKKRGNHSHLLLA